MTGDFKELQQTHSLNSSSSPSAFFERVTSTIRIPPGSVRSSVFTLLTATVGSGILSIPYATYKAGIIGTMILVFIGATAAYFSIWMIVTSSALSGDDGRPVATTYQQLAARCGGTKLEKFTKWILVTNLFGTTVLYMVVIATIIPAAIEAMSSSLSGSEWFLGRWFILLLIVGLVETPLGLMKQISALRYTSLLAIFFALYLTVITVTEYVDMCGDDEKSPKCLGDAINDSKVLSGEGTFEGFVTAVPIIVLSFTCQPNVLPIYIEMVRPSPEKMLRVGRYAFFFASSLYMTIGIFGYLTFTTDTLSDYLLNDYKHHREVLAGGFGLVISVSCSIPLFVHAGRFNILGSKAATAGGADGDDEQDQGYNPLVHNDYDDDEQKGKSAFLDDGDDAVAAHDLSWTAFLLKPEVMHIWVTLLWLAMSYGISSAISNIGIVIGILGSTTIPIIGYILPTTFLIQMDTKNEYKVQKFFALLITGFICLACLANLAFQIKGFAGQ